MNPGQVDVWSIDLARSAAEVIALYELLDAAERGRASKFRAERDRRRFIVAHGTLRMVLGEYLGVEPHRLKFDVRPGGKPTLAGDGNGALHFNLSHSEDLALCAVASDEVGVDVERLRPHDDMQRVAEHFFSEIESRALRNMPGIDRTHFFFRTWVRKEAYLKACGDGLARDTTGFTVNERGAGVTLHTSDGCSVDGSYNVYDLPHIGDHFAALAAREVPAIHFRQPVY
jgi:4'-phosphopantetheinyl transferase